MKIGKQRNEAKYIAIQYFRKEKHWNVSWMCKQLKISHASYYKWLHRIPSETEVRNLQLIKLIKEYDKKYKHILGYRRMTNWINVHEGTRYSKKLVYRLMRTLGIQSKIRCKRTRKPRVSPAQTAENKLQRKFSASRPNEKWTTDVTEFVVPHSKKKIYLSAILDLYDRTIVAYAVSRNNNNVLVFQTLDDAMSLKPDGMLLLHSDRGGQYVSKEFQMKLQEKGITQSMSRVGHCIDNGPTEGFWGIIKTEMYCLYDIHDEQTLIEAIYKYMKFYNRERLQERYGNKTPYEVREEAMKTDRPIYYPIPENKRIKRYKARWEQ